MRRFEFTTGFTTNGYRGLFCAGAGWQFGLAVTVRCARMSDLAQAELSREQLEVLIPLLQAQKRQLGRGSELLVCDMLQKKKKGSTSTSAQYFAVSLGIYLSRRSCAQGGGHHMWALQGRS